MAIRKRTGSVLMQWSSTEKDKTVFQLTDEQVGKAILEMETYLNGKVATALFRKHHVAIRFHL